MTIGTESDYPQNRTTTQGSMDLLAAPQLLQTLRSVEWVGGGDYPDYCPMCFGNMPKHNPDCRLDKTIALLEQVIADGRLLWEERMR